MNICINPFITIKNYNAIIKKHYINQQLKDDTVSFHAMYNNQFSGIDSVILNKFGNQFNIRKFNSVDDLQKWCKEKIEKDYLNRDYTGRRYYSKPKREKLLEEWFNYCLNKNSKYSNAEKLLIIDGITKNLRENNDALPPVFNQKILEDTLFEIKEKAKKNRNYNVNLGKLYQNNLKAPYLSELENGTGWIIVEGLKNDTMYFKENIEKLRILSHHNWCTRLDAEEFLIKGDFHIYMEKGEPKIGICYHGDEISHIEGEENNGTIKPEYQQIVKNHIEKNNFVSNLIKSYKLSYSNL